MLLELTDEDTGCCVSVNGGLWVNCNDFFAPAADAEEVRPEDEASLLAAHKSDPKYGALRWVAERRGIPFKHWHPEWREQR